MAKPKKARLKIYSVKHRKAVKKTKPVKSRKFLAKKPKAKKNIKKIHPIKYRKTIISSKKKLFNRVKKVSKAVKKQVKVKKSKKTKKIIKKSIAEKRKIVQPQTKLADSRDESLFKAKIKVVGIGGGGGSIVSEIGRSLPRASFLVADTDIRALKKRPGLKYFWFGENLTRGLGTGSNLELGKKAALQAKEKVESILKGQDIVILIASLGGGLGSGAAQVFAEIARDCGVITFGIFTMPFKFEGKSKHKTAQNALRALKPLLNVSLVIPNEKIFKIINANTPITQAFSVVNKSLTDSLESLINLIYNPGVINIDFADLRTILRGRGNMSFLNTIEESGKDRADKICKNVLLNPLLQSSKFQAEKILFNISGSDTLSMFEVEKISRHIAESNPAAKIIFGISKNHKLKNKIKTTILMTGRAAGGKFIEDEFESPIIKEVSGPEAAKPEKPKKKISIAEKKNKQKKTKKPGAKKSGSSQKPTEKQDGQILAPVFGNTSVSAGLSPAGEKRLSIVEEFSAPAKKAIRRSGLDVKKVQEQEEKKRVAQEKEWEIPAFLRRVKFNK
ncbi:MAG: hypothetical protein A2402_00340 [Candidatus Staskawiczbacteria bacterium RIFOXYC1_FULL_37_43]|nr:MAG: hypothetical protein A2891_00700 [Candidatus Staskawiczbacteria bacterium RIFCSPLOWO2_01_FULL_37_19]OGZ76075.1 MAG: hypothetical protein A2205_03405 [Candidatus Staskawiczbacteria bacterium RIFOXYA1_FULL_37_15]OGZ77864.1 MAG: hypothetical protein A2280_03650 [Candidatus Staskawiczbacteria bacterium RIFOXYA12_FULL_37_10]OGZ80043.1 MAG: hypothetical protein A2353_02130 [Candidatus Staskawiczbacteria bacterium RIFOXYB1_FULL_38_37]OGZ81682.1 MAG: hypothetical protein A2402_00340 [Candidatus